MKINDSPKRLKNEDQASSKPPKPVLSSNAKESPSRLLIDLGTPRSNSKGSQLFTPLSQHRKTRSFAQSSPRCLNLTPSKSRFDYNALQCFDIDVKAAEAEALRKKAQVQREIQAKKAAEREEWYKLNNERKKQRDEEIIKHEGYLINEKIQFRKMSEDMERERKIEERKERETQFFEMKEAKERMRELEKQKEKERIEFEREKFIKRQQELDEIKEKKRGEKEEKRKELSESISAKKKIQEEAKIRMKKEREFEISQYALGLKESMH